MPVYGENPDEILGILDVRKFLLAVAAGNPPPYNEALDPPSFVSESMRALELHALLPCPAPGMAIVVDEYGGTEGIVTLADIIEEVVGDAIPAGGEDLYIEPLDDHRLLVGGHARLDDISEHEGFELCAEGIDTISGFIFNQLGYLPKAGASIQAPPLTLTVRQVSRKRIGEVLIEKPRDRRAARGGIRVVTNLASSFIEPSTVALVIFCLSVSFLYAGIEAGLLSISRVRLRSRVQQGDRGAVRLQRLLAHPERLLATVLLVTNFADVVALILVAQAFARAFGGAGYVWAGLLMLPIYLVGVQLLPKSLFRRFPYRALAALAGLLEMTSRLLLPLLTVGGWVARRSSLNVRSGSPGLFVAREEFKSLAAEGERVGALTKGERGLIQNVFAFNGLTAADFLRPAPPFAHGERVADLLAFAESHGAPEYLPIADGGGKLAALIERDALLFERDPQRSIATYLRRRPLTVAPGEPAARVLRRLRAGRLSAAGVEDADGRFVGIVRARDLLQQLVGGGGG